MNEFAALASAAGKHQKNIYIIIKESEKESVKFDKSNGLNQGAWHIIVSKSIEEANDALGAYLDNDKADNIVISAHGGTGGGSVELNEDNAKSVGTPAIQAFNNNTLLNSPANAVAAKDVGALQSVMAKLTDGGNFIVTGCQAGLGARGMAFGQSLVELGGCRNINVFLNQDLSEQKYVYIGSGTPTGYASTVNLTTKNRWGITGWENYDKGWLKFTPNEVARRIGILRLNADAPPYVQYNNK